MKLLILSLVLIPISSFADLPTPAQYKAGAYKAEKRHGNCYDGELEIVSRKGETGKKEKIITLNENNRITLVEDQRYPAMGDMPNCIEHTHTTLSEDSEASTITSTMAYDCAGKLPDQISDEKWTFTADTLTINSKPDRFTKRSICVLKRVE